MTPYEKGVRGYWLLFLMAAFILAACGTTPQERVDRELLWGQTVRIYISEAKAGNVDADDARVAIAAINSFRFARDSFGTTPELSACTMAKSISQIAEIIDKPLEIDLVAFCLNPLDDLDLDAISREIEAMEVPT